MMLWKLISVPRMGDKDGPLEQSCNKALQTIFDIEGLTQLELELELSSGNWNGQSEDL